MFDLNDVIKCYTNNISTLVSKLRLSRKKNRKLLEKNIELKRENMLFREEIKTLESNDNNLRNLLSKYTKCSRFLEGNCNKYIKGHKYFYYTKYRIRYEYNIDSDYKYSEWFDDEYSALSYFNNLLNVKSDFIIEKTYTKVNWGSDNVESDDYYDSVD